MKVRPCDKWWCSDVNPSEYMEALAKLWSFNAKYFASESPSTEKGPLASFDLEGMTKASKAFTTLWSSAMEVSQTLARHAQEGKTQNSLITELLGKFLDPKAWFSSMEGMDQALQQLSEGPRLADLWDTERKMLNVFNAWAALRQRSLERGVAAGSWQTCGKSEQKGTNGSAWLVAGIARALGRDCKHGTSRNAAFRRLSQKPAGDTENKHRSAIGTAGDRRLLQRDVWLPDASRAR